MIRKEASRVKILRKGGVPFHGVGEWRRERRWRKQKARKKPVTVRARLVPGEGVILTGPEI